MGHLFFFFLNKYKITSSYWVCLVGRAGMMQLSSTGLNNYYSYHLKARWWWQFLFISRFFWIFSLSGQTFPLRRCWSHWWAKAGNVGEAHIGLRLGLRNVFSILFPSQIILIFSNNFDLRHTLVCDLALEMCFQSFLHCCDLTCNGKSRHKLWLHGTCFFCNNTVTIRVSHNI